MTLLGSESPFPNLQIFSPTGRFVDLVIVLASNRTPPPSSVIYSSTPFSLPTFSFLFLITPFLNHLVVVWDFPVELFSTFVCHPPFNSAPHFFLFKLSFFSLSLNCTFDLVFFFTPFSPIPFSSDQIQYV